MTQKIAILPENLCNKIAAGEVVERPASVAKELLENSLDAGSREISLEVEKGGKRLLRVVDDGEGMGKDDLFLSLERHATSKVRCDEDLFRLATLGFRGEALPSIAAVSRLTLRSRPEESLEGWEIYCEGGTVRRAGAVGVPRGTSIEVRDLFFNTPARRKFLRRDETEIGHIGDVVTKLALAHPQVQFRLVHNGRALLEVYRQGSLAERVGSLLGRPVLGELVEVEAGTPELRLHGLLSQPSASRSTSGAIYTYINGRFIRDKVVQHALLEGYRNILEKGRYPIAVLFLEMDPTQVDVNVHPTKHEVRFREQRLVHDFIAAGVRDALRPSGWLAAREEATTISPRAIPLPSSAGSRAGGSFVPPPPADTDDPSRVHRERVREALLDYGRQHQTRVAEDSPAPATSLARGNGEGTPGAATALQGGAAEGFFSSLTILGQYRRSYLLCQDGDDLVLIDQHAAAERIGFEKLRTQLRKGEVEGQGLLFPAVLELDFRESDQLAEHGQDLRRLGFEVEPFGGRTWAIKGVPRLLGEQDALRLVRDVVGELAALGQSALADEALDAVLMRMACHGVVRANQTLGLAQMQALLADLDAVDFKAHCPHGRPVMKRLTLGEVERMFKRS